MNGLTRNQRRLRLLSDAGGVIAGEREPGVVLDRIGRLLVDTVADVAILYLAEGDALRRAVRVHRDAGKQSLLDRLPDVAPLNRKRAPVRQLECRDDPVFVPPDELPRWSRNDEHARILEALDVTSVLVVPMTGRSGALGGLTAMTVEGGRPPFEDADGETIRELGRRLALALENARYHQDLARHDRRMATLATASHAFTETMLDSEAVLDRIARAVSETVGDFCSVRLVSSDGERMELAAMHHPDAEARRMLASLSEDGLPSAREGMFGEVVGSGEPIFLPTVDPDEMRRRSPASVRPYHDRRSVHGIMIVPMRTPERIIGTVSVWREDPSVPYDDHDRILLQELADQAALAVGSARLFERSEAANRAKMRFLALMSHELRTPVNAVLGHADLLDLGIGGSLTDQQRRTVERIKANCRHLERIMDELLTYAGLDAGEEPPLPVITDLRRPVRNVVEEVEGEARAKGLSLTLDVPTGIEMTLDPRRLEDILLSLLRNAVRFTEEGEVRVEAYVRGDSIVVGVSDTGIGIEPQHLERIFTPFWQAAEPHTRETGGTGLGLALSRRLARDMGGDIRVESEMGVGSTFELILPRRPAREAAERAAEPPPTSRARPGAR